VLIVLRIEHLMFIQSLPTNCNHILRLKNLILLNSSYSTNKMSTLEDVINGLNNVRYRIKEVTKKQIQVFIYYQLFNFKNLIFCIVTNYIFIEF